MREIGVRVRRLLRALLAAYIVTAVCLLILAFVLLKFQPDAQKTGIAILVSYALSCLAGGWACARRAGKRKFLWGMATGAAYYLLLLAASCVGERSLPLQMTQALSVLALCLGSGMAGGMIAV